MITRIASFFLPRPVRKAIKRKVLALTGMPRPNLLTADPWSSPNIWERTIATYDGKAAPAIFEYGAGCSSIHHIRNLLAGGGGSYAAVEHNPDWFNHVCGTLLELGMEAGCACWARARPLSSRMVDFDINFEIAGVVVCRGLLHYRPPHETFRGGEGSADEFDDYVGAIGDGPYDLIVVDGRARKACVNNVLDRGLLSPGGTLALFEAGRGTQNWLGRPTTSGDEDYQPVVQRMLAVGGCLVDGIGYFSWPPSDTELTPERKNPPIPLEACFLTLSGADEDRRVGALAGPECTAATARIR